MSLCQQLNVYVNGSASMIKTNLDRIQLQLVQLGCLVLTVYCFFAFLQLPTATTVGLDPSWRYGISRISLDGLLFGKDIGFTYGSLGYLIVGAPLEQNLLVITLFRIAIHAALFSIAFLKIIQLESILQKIALVVSLIFAYLVGTGVEYETLFSLVIILSFEKSLQKRFRLSAAGFGILSGFFLLTKLTLGLYVFIASFLFFSVSLYKAIKAKFGIGNCFLALIDLLMVTVTFSCLLFIPDRFTHNLRDTVFCLIIAGLASVSVRFLAKRFYNPDQHSQYSKSDDTEVPIDGSRDRLIAWGAGYLIYLICFFTIQFDLVSLWTEFLRLSLEVSSGYSSGMTIISASRLKLVIGLSELVAAIALLIFWVSRQSLNLAVSLIFILMLSFKHGFIRQDGHVIFFAGLTPLIIALCVDKVSPSARRFVYFLHLYALVILLGFKISLSSAFISPSPNKVVHSLSSLINFTTFKAELFAEAAKNLEADKLPPAATHLLEGKTIDIIPEEISLVEANHLNWKPRPTLQSNLANTAYLDNLNFKSLSEQPRDYLLYNFNSIDTRHPFFDEPRTFAYVLCHYQLTSVVPQPVQTVYLPNLMLLEPRGISQCLSEQSGETLSLPWGALQAVPVKKGALIRAELQFKYNLFGKLYKFVFRAEPVRMTVNYQDGSQKTYRIIPENAKNGVIVSDLPKTPAAALAFLRGEPASPVQSFSLHADNPFLYTSPLEIRFIETALQ
jgi:hypothetical protein